MGVRDGLRSDDGFSLMEVVAVLAILGILVAVAMASFFVAAEKSRRIACVHNQRLLDSALAEYQLEHLSHYPDTLSELSAYVKWSGTGFATCVSDNALALGYDSATGEVSCANHPR